MKAREAKLLDVIRNTKQFRIPIYQRNYSWETEQCRKLYDDILATGRVAGVENYFVGSIVYVEHNDSTNSKQSHLVIDGQQRLTTCTLLLSALADLLEKNEIGGVDEDFTVQKIRGYYLTNPLESGEQYFKLLLSETDCETLKSIVDHSPLPNTPSVKIKKNYDLFCKWLKETAKKGELFNLYLGFKKLMIVEINLMAGYDNPQLIFESMNSTGLSLTQADLIRNYILMGLEPSLQTKLYQDYWYKIEQKFGQAAYAKYFDGFMRDYLTVKNKAIPNANDIYKEFKLFSDNNYKNNSSDLVADIYCYANYYCKLVLNDEQDKDLNQAFLSLR